MNADAFRHFYNYQRPFEKSFFQGGRTSGSPLQMATSQMASHFAENRTIWDTCVMSLSEEQFIQPVAYSIGSVRNQVVHMMSCDEQWFTGLRGFELPGFLDPAAFDNRADIRSYWDKVERDMRAYLATLRDDMLFTKPLEGEDENLILWQVLLHVVNHGTDYRAQLLRILHDLGVKTVPQDYIFYVYDHP